MQEYQNRRLAVLIIWRKQLQWVQTWVPFTNDNVLFQLSLLQLNEGKPVPIILRNPQEPLLEVQADSMLGAMQNTYS